MSNVVTLTVPTRIAPRETRFAALLEIFANQRRHPDDVFWMKENAELLNILECTGQHPHPQALAVHEAFYDGAAERLRFFPQYYRFLLSLALDLEDLGIPGATGEEMVDFAAAQDLAGAEMSDLQRAEARRLMLRRGIDPVDDPGLDDRLRAFMARSATFALPNKKAAYELTHIVFYLSEYGRRAPDLPPAALQSLHFAGLTAFLDRNADLLAEICIALRHAGETPPGAWDSWLHAETRAAQALDGTGVSLQDGYHAVLVCNWHAAEAGREIFRMPLPEGATRFALPRRRAPLSEISRAVLESGEARCGDWPTMQRHIAPVLSEEAQGALCDAARSSAHFDAFFEGFARVAQR
jgi:hypothetical protein